MDDRSIEYAVCGVCGSDDSVLLFPDERLSPGRERGIVRCARCGLVYRNVRMTAAELLKHYQDEAGFARQSPDWIERRTRVFRPYLDMLAQYRSRNRILDVGAGHGFFLAACKAAGWECHGIEPSRHCRDFAAREYGLAFPHASIEDAGYEADFFDIVTFWNVLDHVPDPGRTMETVRRLLRPGGLVIVRVPNARLHVLSRSVCSRLGVVAPRLRKIDPSVFNACGFTGKSLAWLFAQARFDRAKIVPAHLAGGWSTSHEAHSGAARKAVASLAAGIANGLFALSGQRLLIAPSLLATARKPEQSPALSGGE